MKPLTEWTEAELRGFVLSPAQLVGKCDYLDELLRRERERCAKECRSWAADMRATWDAQANRWAHQQAAGAEECEHRIRGLQ